MMWCLPFLMSKMNSRTNAWWSSFRMVLSPCGKSSPSFISRPSRASMSFLVASEAALLHADLERVHRLEVRLHVAIRQGARRVDLLERRHRLVEELLVRRRVQRRVEHGDVPVDANESLDLLAEGGQMGRLRDRAVARELVLLGQAEVVGLAGHDDPVRAEEDAEQPVEVARDLREERRHVRGPERNPGAADDLAPGLLDLLDV